MSQATERCHEIFKQGRQAGVVTRRGGRLHLVDESSGSQIILTRKGGEYELRQLPWMGRFATTWNIGRLGATVGKDGEAQTTTDPTEQLQRYTLLPPWGFYGCPDSNESYACILSVGPGDSDEAVLRMFVPPSATTLPGVVAKDGGSRLAIKASAWWEMAKRGAIVPLTTAIANAKPAPVWLVHDQFLHVMAMGRPLVSHNLPKLFVDHRAWLSGRIPAANQGRPAGSLSADARSYLRAIR